MKCPHCESEQLDNGLFCINCGKEIASENAQPDDPEQVKDKSVATGDKVPSSKKKPNDNDFKPSRAPHASIIRRFIALLIDFFILGIAGELLATIITALFVEEDFTGISNFSYTTALYVKNGFIGISNFSLAAVLFTLALGHISYFTFFECSKTQATLGKMLLKIKVVGKRGERLSFATSLKRNFFKVLISWTASQAYIASLGYIVALFNQFSRTFHDSFASTYVIDEYYMEARASRQDRKKREVDPKARRKAISRRFK